MSGDVNGRLQHIEDQVETLTRDVDILKKQGEILIRLESKVDQTAEFLKTVSNNGGFNRCVERGQIIANMSHRLSNLETGNTPEAVQTRADIVLIQKELGDVRRVATAVSGKVIPMEKRMFTWMGVIISVMWAIPIALRYIKF